ncbi:hypothetical protein, variant [Aphanomyces invadans]|uniref:START domain-containing protein n=1 Tax=Aphanomyces invadans TaxID=157072 RepID=A0A024UFU2_9STRA|nr:hypothetical protein, variant [Aphanomyces invadans]XP_008866709.1 hypothetical protein H310_04231 [Aphanomyces invadans]ETW05270.1 hypothetical protein H310_04231 [Aphanomyces invadans]ETW05271.1 hypothetical protein, variant [Aphanomyces invadans]|eukprot:XP_008866708.1 hypothetical protein, variant [Aphanomyces invadans]
MPAQMAEVVHSTSMQHNGCGVAADDDSSDCWRVFLSGLPFLSDAEDGIRDESMAGSSASEADAQPLVAPKTPRRRATHPTVHHERVRKDEIIRLRAEVHRLEAQIQLPPKRPASFWEHLAKAESADTSTSLQVNQDLRAAVNEHAAFIQTLQQAIQKKPRLTVDGPTSTDWQQLVLPANPSTRADAIHAIADRHFRTMHDSFLRAGLLDATSPASNISWAKLRPQTNGDVYFEVASHLMLMAPARTISATAWAVFRRQPVHVVGVENVLEHVDDSTVYNAVTDTRFGPTRCRACLVHKLYQSHHRDVIVSHYVAKDAILDETPGDVVEAKCAWLQVVPLSHHACQLTLLVHINLGAQENLMTREDGDTLASMLENVTIALRSHERGTVATGGVGHLFHPTHLPSPAIHFYVDRSSRFEKELKAAIHQAIRAYNAKPHPLNSS